MKATAEAIHAMIAPALKDLPIGLVEKSGLERALHELVDACDEQEKTERELRKELDTYKGLTSRAAVLLLDSALNIAYWEGVGVRLSALAEGDPNGLVLKREVRALLSKEAS